MTVAISIRNFEIYAAESGAECDICKAQAFIEIAVKTNQNGDEWDLLKLCRECLGRIEEFIAWLHEVSEKHFAKPAQ